MYSFIEGEIISKTDNDIVVRPDGMGVGLKIHVAPRTSINLPGVGGSIRLHTSFQVREDSQSLYGFESSSERDLFEALLKISGLGGKTALSILDLPRDRIVEAIAAGDSAVLRQVKGVGAKTAGRIVLELRDRFADELMTEWADLPGIAGADESSVSESGRDFVETVEALIELGYQRADAREVVRKARGGLGDDAGTEDLLRWVLQHTG